MNDIDDDGICDELEIVGCTDDAACNYDPTLLIMDHVFIQTNTMIVVVIV